MSEDWKKEAITAHLKKVGLNEERIKDILDVIPIDEAYDNLKKNEILKKVAREIGMDEVEKRAKSMGMTVDVFAKEFDRWNDTSGIIVSRVLDENEFDIRNKHV